MHNVQEEDIYQKVSAGSRGLGSDFTFMKRRAARVADCTGGQNVGGPLFSAAPGAETTPRLSVPIRSQSSTNDPVQLAVVLEREFWWDVGLDG
jgi:hypothetical protein